MLEVHICAFFTSTRHAKHIFAWNIIILLHGFKRKITIPAFLTDVSKQRIKLPQSLILHHEKSSTIYGAETIKIHSNKWTLQHLTYVLFPKNI